MCQITDALVLSRPRSQRMTNESCLGGKDDSCLCRDLWETQTRMTQETWMKPPKTRMKPPASESFERRRLQCSDSDHENERGEKQIRTQDNVRIRKVTGKRTTTAATKSGPRCRDHEAPEDSGRSCKQGRDRGRRRDRGRDVRDGDHKSCDRRERDRTNVGRFSVAGSSRNSLGGGESSKQHGELLLSPGTRSIGTPVKKRQQVSSPEEIDGIPNKKTAVDFMVAENALKKKIHEAIQEATGPKSPKQRLSGVVERLSQEQLDELQKQVDFRHMTNASRKRSTLGKISRQLQHAGRTETDTTEVNISTIIEELQTISEAGEEQLEAVKYFSIKLWRRRNSPCLQTWLSLLICNQHRSTHRNSGPRMAQRRSR